VALLSGPAKLDRSTVLVLRAAHSGPAHSGPAHSGPGLTARLETALEGWPGALVVATHDVRQRDGLRIDREIEITA